MRRVGLLFLLLVACSSSTDGAAPLPLAEAERARGLSFLRKPAVVTRTRASYAEEVTKEITDDEVARYRTVWGRLGFVPTDFDLRAASQVDVTQIGAFYEPTDGGRITRFDDQDHPALMVHELVHALQDQHFDLGALDDSAKSTDEWIALRALVEGDARVAETRYLIESAGRDALAEAPAAITTGHAREEAERFLAVEGTTALLSAYAAFCYSWGSVVVAKAIGLQQIPPRWETTGADALFRGNAPRSTEAVMRTSLGIEVDPIVDVGLASLPAPIAEKYEVREVDRLGGWLSWILLREAGELRSEIAMDWDGDQLVVLGPRDPAQPPSAVVWTTAWDNEFVAEQVVDDLHRMHAAAAEPLVIERRGVEVVFAKGTLSEDEVRILASAALYDRSSGPRPAVRRKAIDLERFFDAHSTHAAKSSTRMRHGRSWPPSREYMPHVLNEAPPWCSSG